MGEYFEITFFLEREEAEKNNEKEKILALLMLNEGKNLLEQHKYSLFSNKEVLFDVFEETDFFEYRICLSDFVFTEKNYDENLYNLLKVVDICFNNIGSILFATGIYELTYYNIEGIVFIRDFNKSVFAKFPFVFFKNQNEYGINPTHRYGNVSYVVNIGKDIQDIFSR